MFAAAAGHAEVMRLLLAAGADPTLTVSATVEYKQQVAAALAAGDEDAEQHRGFDTTYTLVNSSPALQIKILFNIFYVDGVTALHLAARGGFLRACELLVESGASVRHQDAEGGAATDSLSAMVRFHTHTHNILQTHPPSTRCTRAPTARRLWPWSSIWCSAAQTLRRCFWTSRSVSRQSTVSS